MTPMRKIADEIDAVQKELKQEEERMANEVREGARQGQEGIDRALRAIHRLHTRIQRHVVTLEGIAERARRELGS
jgi:methyl-accepting chemotaxis protein